MSGALEAANLPFRRHLTFGDEPFVLARVPALPSGVADALYRAPDPHAAALHLFCSRPDVAAAIAIASPSLYGAVLAWRDTGAPKSAGVPRKLLAYAVRMATRPTPFGTFAGACAVEVGRSTSLAAPEPDALRTRSQPDAAWLCSFLSGIPDVRELRPETVVYANDCVERSGDRIVVLHAHAADGSPRAPVAVRATAAVDYVVERCRGGATVAQLRLAVAERFGCSTDAAHELLDRLWQAGLILPRLAFAGSGSMLEAATERAQAADPGAAHALQELAARLARLDATPLPARTADDYAVTCAGTTGPIPLHVDTCASARGTVGPAVLGAAAELATKLLRMRPPLTRNRLRAAFAQRYGMLRMLPIVDFARLFADPDLGNGTSRAPLGAERERALARLVAEAVTTKSAEVVLSDEQLDGLVESFPLPAALPDSLEIGFQIAAASPQAVDEGRFRVVPAPFVGSVPAAKTTTRLAAALGDRTRERLRRFVAPDEDTGTIVAELAYVPHSLHMLNVAARDTLHRYVIQIGFRAEAPGVTRLELRDLYIGIDGDRFFVWSESRRKRVRVVESHALGHAQAPLIARALLAVMDDGVAQPSRFAWSGQEASPFLPRLVSGSCVLSLARWLLPASLGRESDGPSFALALDDWRRRWGVPRSVALCERDNRLPLDLTTRAGRDLLHGAHAGSFGEPIVIEEIYPARDSAWFARDGEAFSAELVVCISKQVSSVSSAPERIPVVVHARPVYLPGSEWCLLELALPGLGGDAALRRVGAFVEDCRRHELLRCWSFRYAGTARLECRFQAADGRGEALLAEACRFAASLHEQQLALRATFATYQPEIELHPSLEGLQHAEYVDMWSSETTLRVLGAGAISRAARITAAFRSGSSIWTCADELQPGAISDAVWRPHARSKLGPEDWSIVRTVRAEVVRERSDPADLRRALGGWIAAQRSSPQCGNGFAAFVDAANRLHFSRFGLEEHELARALRLQARLWTALRRAG